MKKKIDSINCSGILSLEYSCYKQVRFCLLLKISLTSLFVGKFILGGVIVVISIYFGRPFIEYLIAETSNPISLITIAAITIAIIFVTIYYFIKMDWGKIIGKWFPWTLEKDESSDNEDGRENRE